jgi:DNA-binding NarL/FixJ family response regulator
MMPVSMVGRAAELEELSRAWSDRAQRRPAGPVVITGDGGMGKSLLVATAISGSAGTHSAAGSVGTDSAGGFRPRPSAILSGTARVHAPAPYDWLAAVLSGRDSGELRDTDGLSVPPDALAWLAQDMAARSAARGERYAPGALLRMAVRTVRALVADGPALIVVEDLHALDPASLNLVAELAAAPELPALLIVTSRPPDAAVSPRLAARTLARLAGAAGAVRQHLGPLGVTDVSVILAEAFGRDLVSARAAAAVHRRTGGNPYWLREMLATSGAAGPDELAAGPLPDHVRLDSPVQVAHHERPAAALTAREIDVLACLAAGMSNKQVARSLGISPRTVTVHVSNLLRKTRSASRTEAALWAVQHQMASPR